MSVFDKLTNHELDMMEYYITCHGAKEGSSAPIKSMDYLLRFWKDAKDQYLYKMFGDNLIIEKEIKFEKSFEQLQDDMRKKVTDYYYSDSAKECREFIKNWNHLSCTLSDDRELYWTLQRLIQDSTLASNRYDYPGCEIPLPNGKKYRISQGCKVSKAIGKIANAYGLAGYETFRIYHSQVLNEKSISGILCLSIHPLDYMTMSDNDCGWSSCMSWYDHGDYRQGTVEMMNSPSVVVAYLKSSTDYKINSYNDYSWNSKRWRELFIVDEGFITGIKGYPYWNTDLEKNAVNWIAELAQEAGIGKYEESNRVYDGNKKEVKIDDDTYIDLEYHTRLMYNDFYEKHTIRLAKEHNLIPSNFTYSGPSECMCCSEDISLSYDSEQDLFCLNCDDVVRCVECGEYHSRENMIEVYGDYYCQYCYDENFSYCPSCEELVRNEDFYEVYLGKDKNHVWQDKMISLCHDCLHYGNPYFDTNALKTFYRTSYSWYETYYVEPSDLTEEGLREFGFKSVEEAYNFKSKYKPFEGYN